MVFLGFTLMKKWFILDICLMSFPFIFKSKNILHVRSSVFMLKIAFQLNVIEENIQLKRRDSVRIL